MPWAGAVLIAKLSGSPSGSDAEAVIVAGVSSGVVALAASATGTRLMTGTGGRDGDRDRDVLRLALRERAAEERGEERRVRALRAGRDGALDARGAVQERTDRGDRAVREVQEAVRVAGVGDPLARRRRDVGQVAERGAVGRGGGLREEHVLGRPRRSTNGLLYGASTFTENATPGTRRRVRRDRRRARAAGSRRGH